MGDLLRRLLPGSPARGRTDAGVTLIETLIVMMLFSGILIITYTVLAGVQQQTADTQSKSDDAARARLGLAQIDRQVRSGNVLYSPAGETGTAGCTAATTVPNAGTCMRVYTPCPAGTPCTATTRGSVAPSQPRSPEDMSRFRQSRTTAAAPWSSP